MKPARISSVLCILSLLATATSATATNYTITWKNQFASNATCTLDTSVETPTGTIPNSTKHTFTSLGQTKPVTISSPTCSHITVSAGCSFTDAQGKSQRNSFSSQVAPCGNSTAILNATRPGSITVTTTAPKPNGVL